MGSRVGLNPKIRSPKGVGFGRALPGAFSFGKCYSSPNTAGSYFTVPLLAGGAFPSSGTIEFWQTIPSDNGGGSVFRVVFSDGSNFVIENWAAVAQIGGSSHLSVQAIPINRDVCSYGTRYHCAFIWTSTYADAWCNYVFPGALNGSGAFPVSSPFGSSPIVSVSLGARDGGSHPINSKLDEFRFYNRVLDLTEIAQNDGYMNTGANPTITEGLQLWYQFEQFETFDFSSAQDGTDLALGIRDFSGKGNHAKAQSLITNPASGSYVLQPF